MALDYITNQPFFTCDETRKQLLSAASTSPRKHREEIEEARLLLEVSVLELLRQ